MSINSVLQERVDPRPITLRHKASDDDLPAELFVPLSTSKQAHQRPTADIKGLPDSKQTSKVFVEVSMPKAKMGRPLRGSEPMGERVSTILTADQKARLDAICAEKRWSMATLLRELIETRYPEVFAKEKK